MALQFHRLFAPRLSVMSHCSTGFQNYPGIFLPYCPYRCGGSKLYGHFHQLKFGKVGETCRMMSSKQLKDLRCMVERHSFSLPGTKCFLMSSFMESSVNGLGRRFFSVTPTHQVKATNASDKVTVKDGKTTVSDTKKPASVNPNTKKDKKSELTFAVVAESSSDTHAPKAGVKKKPQTKKKNEVKPSASIASSGEAKAEVPKKVPPRKKTSVSKVGPSPQAKKSESSQAEQESKQPKESSTKPKKEVKLPTKSKSPKKVNGTPVMVQVSKRSQENALKPLYPPTGKSVVVVESLTKAKVIQGYLGNMFEVLPSYGHVRDLAGRSGSVRPDDDFSVVWEVPSAAWTHLKSIKVALNGANNLILASDPDREGEAIAWHIMEMLQQQEAIPENMTVSRVVFHEITELSIKSALQAPRDIDANLVHAYLARRALDYLIGFSISPLLWKKLPACQSAGRVQSAALGLICDKEMEIDEFKPQEYWSVAVEFKKTVPGSLDKVVSVPSHLTHSDFKKLEQLSISSEEEVKAIEQKINSSSFVVLGAKRSKTRRNPPPPYITSTLQQDAANKLHFSPFYTMKLAQKLYEGVKLSEGEATGLITYMRTDGLHVSDFAAKDIRSLVIQRYGHDFAPESPRKYFKKVKNAQEAHEAIRPTNIGRLPSMLSQVLDEDCLKLYSLIWSRTMACQMEPCLIDQIQVDIGSSDKSLICRSTSSRVDFLGYQAVLKDLEVATVGYEEKDRDLQEEVFKVLGTLNLRDPLQLGKVKLTDHSTQPPSRYSEGSLIKKLEELGIGRPSTYASTIKVLKDRNYVTTKSRVLYPEFRGRMVSAFLSHHFSEVTDYSFTADMETELDNVSAGTTEWKGLLKDYWSRFSTYCDNAASVDIRQVEKMLEGTFGNLLFASLPDRNRTCPSCLEGTLSFKVSRFGQGYFIGCDQHPKCKYIARMIGADDEDDENPQKTKLFAEPKVVGIHPSSSEKILLKNGPYGFYVQLGDDRKGYSPKRASVSHIKNVDAITLEDAMDLLRYPIELGKHPEDGSPVYLRLSKYGFAIKHRGTVAAVPKAKDPKDITLEKALKFLLGKHAKRCGRPKGKPKVEEAIDAI